jgi:hypothetical protein
MKLQWDWMKLHSDQVSRFLLLTKYYPGDQIKNNEVGGACAKYGGKERCIKGIGGKPEGKRPLRRPRRRYKDDIKMDLNLF